MKAILGLLLLIIAYADSQDTYSCPDGWEKHSPEGEDECKCFLFADNFQRVTHDEAGVLCKSHGAILAELEDGPGDNYWVVSQLIDRHTKKTMLESRKVAHENSLGGPHYEDQWWIGAKSYTRHDEHRPGEWRWEHENTTVEWFDWAPYEPNDYHRQQCLTFLRYDYGEDFTYNWNDWDCNTVADYICEKLCVN